jgi:hypothetical protein
MEADEKIAALKAMAALLRNSQHSLTSEELEGVAHIIEHIAEFFSRDSGAQKTG